MTSDFFPYMFILKYNNEVYNNDGEECLDILLLQSSMLEIPI